MLTILLAGLAPMPCSAEFRDPTQPAYQLPPATDAAGGDTELVLSAIWISPHSRRATINGVLAKQGQTIDIEQASTLNHDPATPENTATAGDKKDVQLKQSTMDTASPKADKSTPTMPSAHRYAAPASPTVGALPSVSLQSSITAPIPAHSTTIKIISIHKNSVTIDQNGERKTLQLVQRPYKTQ